MNAEPQTREPWKLFFDGSCNLCTASSRRVRDWGNGRGQPIELHTLQSPMAQDRGYGTDRLALEAGGKTYYAAEAWLKLMELAPWYFRWVSWTQHNRVTKWIVVKFYNFIAQHRHFWLGRRDPGVPCPSGGG